MFCIASAGSEPEKPDAFEPTQALMKRYWLVDDQKAMTTREPWMLDFVIEEKPGARGGFYGKEWYEHKAKLRLRMAGEPQTLVVHGVWGDELARLVSEQHKGAKLDQLATVVARRTGRVRRFSSHLTNPTAAPISRRLRALSPWVGRKEPLSFGSTRRISPTMPR